MSSTNIRPQVLQVRSLRACRRDRTNTYTCCKTASETHFTKKYVNPRMATGGAIGILLAVTKLTKWPILSREGVLREY